MHAIWIDRGTRIFPETDEQNQFVGYHMLQRRFDSFNQQRNAQDPFRTGFQRIKEAGLTLKGCKCHIGKDEVIYLEHVFSANGMRPDEKIAAVKDWPTPKDATEIRQFLGLASYY